MRSAWTAAALLAAAAAQAWAAAPARPAGPERVTVGAYINDIQTLDLKTHSYALDLYLWFRWRDPKLNPSASFEFMNPFELWAHIRSADYAKPVRLPNGEYYQVVRNRGAFSRKLPLDDYPFDRQTLVVEMEDSDSFADKLAYAPDPLGVTVNPDLKLPGFTVGRPRLTVRQHVHPTVFGDTRHKTAHPFSRVLLEIPIERPLLPYSLKLIVPILCVVTCAALMFLFHPKHVDSRVGIGITALLTIVALQITLNDDLPEIAYLVLLDKLYLLAYVFVIAGLGVVVRSTWLLERNEVDHAIRTDRISLVLLTGGFLATMACLILSTR